jgi:hypothetical protein
MEDEYNAEHFSAKHTTEATIKARRLQFASCTLKKTVQMIIKAATL